jgi:hypothetical protein
MTSEKNSRLIKSYLLSIQKSHNKKEWFYLDFIFLWFLEKN